jgi:hypothetical protein
LLLLAARREENRQANFSLPEAEMVDLTGILSGMVITASIAIRCFPIERLFMEALIGVRKACDCFRSPEKE